MIGDASISSMTKSDIPRDLCGAFSLFPLPFLLLYRTNVDYWTTGKKKRTTTTKRNGKKEKILAQGLAMFQGDFSRVMTNFAPHSMKRLVRRVCLLFCSVGV